MRVTAPSSWPWIDHSVSGLRPATKAPYSDSVSLRLPYAVKLATERKSLTHYTKGTQSPQLKASCFKPSFHSFLNLFTSPLRGSCKVSRCFKLGLPLFVCIRFQVLFHSPPGVLFAFPSRYWFTIGRSRVFSLGGWSPHLQTGFRVSRPTCRMLSTKNEISCTGLSPTMADISRSFHYLNLYHIQAIPRSLATTDGISVDFFSSSYLDVSVHSVRFHVPMYSVRDTLAGGFPHSDIAGSKLYCQLPRAFRRLTRPSSPVIAKASTRCT